MCQHGAGQAPCAVRGRSRSERSRDVLGLLQTHEENAFCKILTNKEEGMCSILWVADGTKMPSSGSCSSFKCFGIKGKTRVT